MSAIHALSSLRPLAALGFSISLLLSAGCAATDESDDDSASPANEGESTFGGAIDITSTPSGLRRGRFRWTATTSTTKPPAAPPASTSTPASATTPASASAPASAAPAAVALPYRGVNLSGAEFGTVLPGAEGRDYTWPTNAEVDYFMSKGMNTFRVNFMWERVQPTANGELDAAYLAKLDALVGYATSKRATVLLNPQNFARYYGTTVGSTQVPNAVFANFWGRLATHFAGNARVMFGLVNEPHDIGTEQWVGAANAAIASIRSAGAKNTVLVPGNAWTGAHSWNDTWYGTSNAVALLKIVDPSNNIVFEAHQYLDPSSGGKTNDCVSTTIGRERLQPFITWLRANGKKGFIGEFAGGDNPTCNAAITDMLNAMESASDVLTGWLWWAGGPWWGDYGFSIEVRNNGQDAAQMSLLTPRLQNLPLF